MSSTGLSDFCSLTDFCQDLKNLFFGETFFHGSCLFLGLYFARTLTSGWTIFEGSGQSGQVTILRKSFPISLSLKTLAQSYADQRVATEPIFTFDRSSIENCLSELAEELGDDFFASPITPETFLELVRSGNVHRYIPQRKILSKESAGNSKTNL